MKNPEKKKVNLMTRYELIMLIIFGVAFLLQTINFPGSIFLFAITTWVLAISYAVFGIKLFKNYTELPKWFKIVTGILIGITLWPFYDAVHLRLDTWEMFTPVACGILLMYIIVTWITKRRLSAGFKAILYRIVPLLTLSCFFTFLPVEFSFYRNAAYLFNGNRPTIQQNILMFEKTGQSEEFLEAGNCREALRFAIQANEHGKNWLGIRDDENEQNEELQKLSSSLKEFQGNKEIQDILSTINNSDRIYKISGTYMRLFRAYLCVADDFKESQYMDSAYHYYTLAERNLTIQGDLSDYWKEQLILNYVARAKTAITGTDLSYELSDSLFLKATTETISLLGETHPVLAAVLFEMGESLSERQAFEDAITIFETANLLLINDSTNDYHAEVGRNKVKILKALALSQQHWKSILYADELIKEYSETPQINTVYSYKFISQMGVGRYKGGKESILKCLAVVDEFEASTKKFLAKAVVWTGVASANIALANYNEAQTNLDSADVIFKEKNLTNDYRYTFYLLQKASLLERLCEYQDAKTVLQDVLKLSTKHYDFNDPLLIPIYVNLSDVELKLEQWESAQTFLDSAYSVADYNYDSSAVQLLGLQMSSAYYHYLKNEINAADSVYNLCTKILKMNHMMETFYFPEKLNGEALLEIRKNKRTRADSVFTKAIHMYSHFLRSNHPNISIMKLNSLENKLDLGKLKDVEKGIIQVEQSIIETVGVEHGLYADLLVLKSKLAGVKKDKEKAKSLKKQALEIYKLYYPMDHSKIQELVK